MTTEKRTRIERPWNWSEMPLGTRVYSSIGGWWERTERGWTRHECAQREIDRLRRGYSNAVEQLTAATERAERAEKELAAVTEVLDEWDWLGLENDAKREDLTDSAQAFRDITRLAKAIKEQS